MIVLTRIAEGFSQIASQVMALVKGPQRQKPGIAGDLAAGKISVNGSMSVERKKPVVVYSLSLLDAPKGSAGFTKTQCSSTF